MDFFCSAYCSERPAASDLTLAQDACLLCVFILTINESQTDIVPSVESRLIRLIVTLCHTCRLSSGKCISRGGKCMMGGVQLYLGSPDSSAALEFKKK